MLEAIFKSVYVSIITFNSNGDTYLQIYSADSRVSASIDFDLLLSRKMLFIIVKKYIFLVLQFFKIRTEYRIHQMRPYKYIHGHNKMYCAYNFLLNNCFILIALYYLSIKSISV